MIDRSTTEASSSPVDWMERAAVGASLACLAHCLALPLLLAALPMFSRWLSVPEAFHLWVLVFAVPASMLALVSGWSRHRGTRPLVLGVSGLVLLAIGTLWFGETWAETPVTVMGSLTLAGAHLLNWRRRHACGC